MTEVGAQINGGILLCVCVSEVCVHVKMLIRSAGTRPPLCFLDSFTLPTFSAAAFVLAGSKPELLLFKIQLSSISGANPLCGDNPSQINHRHACVCSRVPTTLLLLEY